ncbi:hypothetical protein FHL15_008260 [Xylaria flabelliformis]|uniref:Cation/H+ exchanger transmembrane domain-containing protein n=1 Tax=Xylaria flabelliformis TaxID=2512241 RepID=A0A553HSD1_9PEZI|nr:hypothetical protein FHL15_008260 [Xylaria flabelliformis]
MSTPSYLPYHEPSLIELLITSTFLLTLNGINSALDRTLACGLVGQVLIGTAWGSPGAGWLTPDFERVASNLGYLGLILVVYAGGVETDVVALRKNIVLSVAVAITGVVVPIALSFALLATPGQLLGGNGGGTAALLPAFAAGAALCSTSLGTTFSVLQASGLSRTRLGAVLASAALLDDVVGLVMVRIITSLGETGNNGTTILRPVLVSVAFAVAVPLVCRYVVRPGQIALDHIVQRWDSKEKERKEGSTSKKTRVAVWIRSQEAAFIIQTALLILLVVAADYAGASIFLAAYLAGVIVSWWVGQRDGFEASSPDTHSAEMLTTAEQQAQGPDRQELETTSDRSSSDANGQETPEPRGVASRVFDSYYAHAVTRVLKPFFFASIGFSIPISRLFVGGIVWRGIIYSILMIIVSKYGQTVSKIQSWSPSPTTRSPEAHDPQSNEPQTTACMKLSVSQASVRLRPREPASSSPQNSTLATPPKPLSLYPAAVMGSAMVARGEIGFLISSIAESQGVFRRANEDASQASELFLIVTWAIFICTILGPICTGLLVRRIKKLEKASEASRGGTRDVLGVWGIG